MVISGHAPVTNKSSPGREETCEVSEGNLKKLNSKATNKRTHKPGLQVLANVGCGFGVAVEFWLRNVGLLVIHRVNRNVKKHGGILDRELLPQCKTLSA